MNYFTADPTHYYMGIDPGLSGAVAVYQPESNGLTISDTPVFTLHGRRTVDMAALAHVFHGGPPINYAVMELVHAMPKQGVSSTFSFGKAAGAAEAMLAAHGIAHQLISPGAWKRAMQCPADKDGARQRASQLLPAHAHLWTRKKDDGRAEAALMAVLARRLAKGDE